MGEAERRVGSSGPWIDDLSGSFSHVDKRCPSPPCLTHTALIITRRIRIPELTLMWRTNRVCVSSEAMAVFHIEASIDV